MPPKTDITRGRQGSFDWPATTSMHLPNDWKTAPTTSRKANRRSSAISHRTVRDVLETAKNGRTQPRAVSGPDIRRDGFIRVETILSLGRSPTTNHSRYRTLLPSKNTF